VVRKQRVVRGGSQVVSEGKKVLKKTVSDNERMKNTPYMSVLELSLLADLQQQ
jgi:hypothetical protein